MSDGESRGAISGQAARPAGSSGTQPELGQLHLLRDADTLNQLAARVGELIGENRGLGEVAATIAGEFGIGRDAALAATREIVASFQNRPAPDIAGKA